MGQLGRFLDNLTPEQRGRVLTREMRPCSFTEETHTLHCGKVRVGPCLMTVTHTPLDGQGLDHSTKYSFRYATQSPIREIHEWNRLESGVPPHTPAVFMHGVPGVYDALCGRYGFQRVNAWIRDRALRGMEVTPPVAALAAV